MANAIDLAILAAVPAEIRPLSGSLPSCGNFDIAGSLFTLHEYHGITLATGATGIGKVNAAAIAAAFLTRFGPLEVWNIGCSGAYNEAGLSVTDVLITTKWICGDEGVIEQPHAIPTASIGIPLLSRNGTDFFDHFQCHQFEPRKIALNLVSPGRYSINCSHNMEPAFPGEAHEDCFTVAFGPSLTIGMASGDEETARLRFKAYRTMAENMEGSAVAQVCLLFGTPFLECRGISNMAGIRDKSKWKFEKAIFNCHSVIRHILDSYGG